MLAVAGRRLLPAGAGGAGAPLYQHILLVHVGSHVLQSFVYMEATPERRLLPAGAGGAGAPLAGPRPLWQSSLLSARGFTCAAVLRLYGSNARHSRARPRASPSFSTRFPSFSTRFPSFSTRFPSFFTRCPCPQGHLKAPAPGPIRRPMAHARPARCPGPLQNIDGAKPRAGRPLATRVSRAFR